MFGERIASALLKEGALTAAQVESARRTQGFFGGDLSTHLVQLGLVDEDTVARVLSRITSAPYAWGRDLRAAPADVVGTVPGEVLATHRACPFARDGSRLLVAFVNPGDSSAVQALRAAARCDIQPCVTAEYQLEAALQRLYGIRPEGRRSLRVPSTPGTVAPGSGAPNVADADDAEVEANGSGEPEVGLDGLPIDAEPDLAHPLFFGARGGAPEAASAEEPPTVPEEAQAEEVSNALDRFSRQLAHAVGRDEVTLALLEFGASQASRVAVFAVQPEEIRCVSTRGRGLEDDRVLRASFPRGTDSVFDAALNSASFYFGPVPPSPPNRDIFTVLGGRLPRMVMVLPIAVKGRRVAFLYLDNDDGLWKAPDVPLMRRVAGKAGLALEILLLKRKLLET